MNTHKESTDVNKPYYSATLAHQIQTPQKTGYWIFECMCRSAFY